MPEQLPVVLDWVRAHPITTRGRTLPVCVWGEKGVGKTACVASYARDHEWGFRTYQPAHDSSGADALGTSYRDDETNRTHYAIPQFLPTATEVDVFAPHGVLLLDEINRATPQVLAGLFELLGEGTISQSGYEMPAGWQIVCTANPEGGDYAVTGLDPALKDRMLHIALDWHPSSWVGWARRAGLEEDVIRYVAEDKPMPVRDSGLILSALDLGPTPRSLANFAALYRPTMEPWLLEVVCTGLLGPEAAAGFLRRTRGASRPLTGAQVLDGTWGRYREEFADAAYATQTTATMRSVLEEVAQRPVEFMQARQLHELLVTLPVALSAPARDALQRQAPDWARAIEEIMRRGI